MSVRTRLNRLERGKKATPDNFDAAMAHLIGTIDGLFWPIAYELEKLYVLPTIQNERSQYHETGIAWSGLSTGRDAAAWKTNQRQREALEKAGLITINRAGSKPLVKPTPEAMRDMQQRLGLFHSESLDVLKVKVRTMIALVAKGSLRDEPDAHPWAPGELGWCHETWLFGREYSELPKRCNWAPMQELVLPLLIDGTLETKQTTIKHICYRYNPRRDEWDPVKPVTEADAEAIMNTIEELAKAEEPAPKRQVSEVIEDIYTEAFHDQCDRNEQHQRTDEIFIPLPATSIGVVQRKLGGFEGNRQRETTKDASEPSNPNTEQAHNPQRGRNVFSRQTRNVEPENSEDHR